MPAAPVDLMITTRGLTKEFTAKKETVRAVVDLDLDVADGELVAFLGPNGAGKTTTLRMLTTLLPPTRGTALVAGHDVASEPAAVRARIGYVGQGDSAGHYQRVRDELVSQGTFYGLTGSAARARTDELLESLELRELAERKVLNLSGGQRRRLDIALGLVHRPRLLFLDEPSTGLDPQSRANLWRHITDLRASTGTTVFLTTHYLEEADQMAERVMIMDHGRVIADDTAAGLKARLAGDRIHVRLGAATDRDAGASAAGRVLGVNAIEGSGAELTLHVTSAGPVLPQVLRALDSAAVAVTAATTRQPTLDDVFLALTGRSLREDVAAGPDGDAATTIDLESSTQEARA